MFYLLGQLNSHFLIFCVENDSRRNFAIFAFWRDWRISSNSARLWIFVSYVWSDCHLHILILNKRWHDQKYWPQNVKLCRCFQKWRLLPFMRNVSIFPPFMFDKSRFSSHFQCAWFACFKINIDVTRSDHEKCQNYPHI